MNFSETSEILYFLFSEISQLNHFADSNLNKITLSTIFSETFTGTTETRPLGSRQFKVCNTVAGIIVPTGSSIDTIPLYLFSLIVKGVDVTINNTTFPSNTPGALESVIEVNLNEQDKTSFLTTVLKFNSKPEVSRNPRKNTINSANNTTNKVPGQSLVRTGAPSRTFTKNCNYHKVEINLTLKDGKTINVNFNNKDDLRLFIENFLL